jgi:hypothetical protein
MKHLGLSIALLASIVLLCGGCKSLGIVQLSSDTYMASKTSAGGIWVSMASLKEEVISAANAFAENKGKMAIPVNSRETPAIPGRNPSFEYQFRLVDKNDPAGRGVSLNPRPDVVIEKTENISADIRTKNESGKQANLYTEILKLDDLRKKGLITDAEYEVQKQKLLSR